VKGKVLKLTSGYLPIDIVDWKEAITDWCSGRVEIIEYYDDQILRYGYNVETDSHAGEMQMPAVIRTKAFHRPKKSMRYFKPFSRRNVYERDGGRCQYCGKNISMGEMTYDHVKPKRSGGLTKWTNIVTSCVQCNSKKADMSCDEAKMFPLVKPVAPELMDGFVGSAMEKIKTKMSEINNLTNHVWVPYLGNTNKVDNN